MRKLIQEIITWEKLGDELSGKPQFTFKDAVMSRDAKSLRINMGLNFVVPYEDHLKITAVLINKLETVENVHMVYEYGDMVLGEEKIVEMYSEYIEEFAGDKLKGLAGAVTDIDADGENVTFVTAGRYAAEKLSETVSAAFEKALKDNFAIERSVNFRSNEELLDKTAKSMAEAEKSAIEEKENQRTAVAGPKKAKGGTSSGNRLMGREITGEPVPLSELSIESGKVTVEGILFRKEEKKIRTGNKVIKLLITDKKTSVCLKSFVSEEKWSEIDSALKPGDMVRAQGETEFDTFENTLMVSIKVLEKGTVEKKEDTAEEKRVELHLHTCMSALDGFCNTKAVINRAVDWGHKAIAITDHGVVQSFPDAAHAVYDGDLEYKTKDIKVIYGVEAYLYDDEGCIDKDGNIDIRKHGTNHAVLLAKNQTGLKNLYKLVSISHLDYIYRKPRMPKSIISKYREGLILGAACEAGEVFRAIVSKAPEEELKKKIEFYDYLEIQPLVNNSFMMRSENHPDINSWDDLKNLNRKVVELGEKYGKPVAATCDAHYIDPEDAKFREIILAGQGYTDITDGLYFRTTDEMLEEFSYLGEEKAREVVIETPNMIADMVEEIIPIAKGKFPPKIENAEEILEKNCYERAKAIYGDPLPEKIAKRLDKELTSIISNEYAVMYVSAEMLVKKSLSDGFLVGSRGSVGSSFAATMAGITEVNPLAPHYICPECRHLIWGDENEYDCGVDMPEKMCPECGTKMKQDGFAIPFETFLGFKGDKEPDIDLNFAGEYQATAHRYVGEIFGNGNVYKAGTVSALKDKTAFGFVRKYFEEKDMPVNKYEIERLIEGCVGVKRTTGQHPGGIIIVPEGHEIYEFCPIQHPANDADSDITTTHFDYHSIDQNLLKLDILGHDVPSMIRQLQDITGVDPLSLPLKDERVNSIFNSLEGLNIKDKNYKFTHGSYGIPEFGTKFVRQMLDDTKPQRFGDLVRISGFSHGTNVWLNNAQQFIKEGKATMQNAISTRDDIMNYLILKGLPNDKAFKIMEKVRKGKGVEEENVQLMKANDVPDWYVESCQRISYMFPRAHAVAYVIMSYRIAYFKVYYPAAFYAVLFTAKIGDFNWSVIKHGSDAILRRIEEIENKGRNATKKEEDEIIVLELAYEMYARGYSFESPTLAGSTALKFTVTGDAASETARVKVPLCALMGVGESVGIAIENEYKKKPFMTVEEMQIRAKVNKTATESLREAGVLEGMSETDQMSLF